MLGQSDQISSLDKISTTLCEGGTTTSLRLGFMPPEGRGVVNSIVELVWLESGAISC